MPRYLIAIDGPLKGKILPFAEGKKRWIIGRDGEEADLILMDPSVSRKHIECFEREDGIVLKDLSHTNPILVNDQALFDEHLLKEGDQIKIGQNLFAYQEKPIENFPKEEPIVEEKPEEEVGLETVFLEEKNNKEEPTLDTFFEEFEPPIPQKEELEKKESFKEETGYETIFEEPTPTHEEAPLKEDQKLILKVLSGPNTGAEFSLEKNRVYLMGKDPNTCDIAFNDLSVSRHHASLKIDDQKVMMIEDLGSKNRTLVNGHPIEDKKVISYQDLVTMGTTTFVIIDKEMEAETIYTPYPEMIEAKELAKKIEPSIEMPKMMDWKERVIPYRYLWVAGSFLVVLVISLLGLFSLFKAQGLQAPSKNIAKEMTQVLGKYDGVQFSYNPNNESLFLSGHILTTVDKQELLYTIDQLPNVAYLEDNIVIDELVWKSMNGILSDNKLWRGVTIHSPSSGKFVLQGTIQTTKQAEELMDYLNMNFSYIDRLENKLVIQDILDAEIRSLLFKNGFQVIGYAITNGELILTGKYSEERLDVFQALMLQMKKLPGVMQIKNLAIATSPENARVDLSDKYKVTGFVQRDGKNFGVLVNGKIITSGDLLDQMKVTAIDSHIILLEKDDIKYKISFNQASQ